jgi:hypothetical protein
MAPIALSFNNLLADLEGRDPELVQVWVDATREFGQYECGLH